jgi:hypothetical protein
MQDEKRSAKVSFVLKTTGAKKEIKYFRRFFG